MQQEQSPKFSEITMDTISAKSYGYPRYLDNIKLNLETYLPLHNISIIAQQTNALDDDEVDVMKSSIVITSQNLLYGRYQLWTEAYLQERTFTFSIKHILLLNNKSINIHIKQSEASFLMRLCNKINKRLQPCRLVIHPLSGKIYFETKSMINNSSLNHLKKNLSRHDCYYTELIISSLKKADRYSELILYFAGLLDIGELIKSKKITTTFGFFKDCYKILTELEQSLFYMDFLNINKQYSSSSFTYLSKLNKNQDETDRSQNDLQNLQQKKLRQTKSNIIQNSLQFYHENIEETLKIYKSQNSNIYQNVNFLMNPFKEIQNQELINQRFATQSHDRQKQQSIESQRILTYVQIMQNQQSQEEDEQQQCHYNYFSPQNSKPIKKFGSYKWELISEGGFGVIQIATVKYKNLQSSYRQPDNGYQLILKSQFVKKSDRYPDTKKKFSKIQRQRNILEKLKFHTHPNIMKFYISIQEEYQNCIFSNFFSNLSLDLYLKKNQLSLSIDKKINLLIQAVESLIFIHGKGIVHLDIKPGNYIVSKNNRLLLSDFGQAFLIGQDNPLTHRHAYTVPYCAPQIFYQQCSLTPKADVYAIAVCIFKIIFPEQNFFDTFFKKRFLNRLKSKQLFNIGIGQKFESFFLQRIYKVVTFVTFKAIHQDFSLRLGLNWINQILNSCKSFFYFLLYDD